jgi:hypothetical protein
VKWKKKKKKMKRGISGDVSEKKINVKNWSLNHFRKLLNFSNLLGVRTLNLSSL